MGAPKTGPKPYKEVITGKAKSSKGLFTVHKVDDKFYFEINESLFGKGDHGDYPFFEGCGWWWPLWWTKWPTNK